MGKREIIGIATKGREGQMRRLNVERAGPELSEGRRGRGGEKALLPAADGDD